MKNITLLCLLALTVACGKAKPKHRAPLVETMTPAQVSYLLSHQAIACSDGDFCPEGMARLFSVNYKDNSKSQMCGAFLVAEDLVLTNSHCVWSDSEALKTTCEGVSLSFPKTSGAYETAGCSEIIYRDKNMRGNKKYSKGVNDFALIRLDRKLTISPLTLRPQGLKVGAEVFPLVMDHQGPLEARITKLSCFVSKVDELGVATLADCPVISGNSGSVVVDEKLNVVGIIFGSSDTKIRNSTDALPERRRGGSDAYAFSVDQMEKVLTQLSSETLARRTKPR